MYDGTDGFLPRREAETPPTGLLTNTDQRFFLSDRILLRLHVSVLGETPGAVNY